ncbi:hypothetical protein V6N12_021052 [Hibiscus sabdariffa]|uniref:Uncharacterized protein n=1 Tax=Hibiscus sabdariffa TaxID=183260 RepID=A0ABR2B460_9ROSI
MEAEGQQKKVRTLTFRCYFRHHILSLQFYLATKKKEKVYWVCCFFPKIELRMKYRIRHHLNQQKGLEFVV